ncbi:hypothetical protein TIFTF001_012003 [Ficus carica]|uniref:Uncharacterized protein n=1 Tax=Ficus carica TaxID=3494 RepID=A0AA88D1A3_FICCA|nr:hypothetical protein TIFTF001_012003 [Ficus carica]
MENGEWRKRKPSLTISTPSQLVLDLDLASNGKTRERLRLRLRFHCDSGDSFCHDSWPAIPQGREEVASRHSGNSGDCDIATISRQFPVIEERERDRGEREIKESEREGK